MSNLVCSEFEARGYTKISSLLTRDCLDWLAPYCLKAIWSDRSNAGGEKQHYTDHVRHIYGDHKTDELLTKLATDIGNVVQRRLLPTYSFFRFYPKGSGMKPHIDRPSCEYSVSVCLSYDYSNLEKLNPNYRWPIFMNGKPMTTEPGDAVIYKGMEVKHWREPLIGKSHLQLFLHYVDAHGPYAETHLYDGREALGTECHIG